MEKIKNIFKNENSHVEVIQSNGEISPKDFWYDQDENEIAKVLKGEAELEFIDGVKANLKASESFYIPKHMKHRVSYTSKDCVWICFFTSGD